MGKPAPSLNLPSSSYLKLANRYKYQNIKEQDKKYRNTNTIQTTTSPKYRSKVQTGLGQLPLQLPFFSQPINLGQYQNTKIQGQKYTNENTKHTNTKYKRKGRWRKPAPGLDLSSPS